ncbi:MAG: YiiX/YebB-like N1pC/P60 family cysteine hydrolase [Candidatus Falkowbacteria bacterium]
MKIFKLNNYHRINNFPERSSLFKKILSQVVFLILVTKITRRKNRLGKKDYFAAKEIIKPGDLVLVGGFRTVSGFFMGKTFTHSLLYIGDGQCIHADADGVDTITFAELFLAYDTMVILRAKIEYDYEAVIQKVITFAKSQIGKPYDFYLEHRRDRYFCTQLINVAFKNAGFDTGVGNGLRIKKHFLWILWRIKRVVKAGDFLHGNFKIVFKSKSLKRKK